MAIVRGARESLEMTELGTVAIRQRLALGWGVQQLSQCFPTKDGIFSLAKSICAPDRLLFQPNSRAFRSWKEIAEALVEDPVNVCGF
jgi:hypothetical protein